ncbi:MAG: twin-arginine translocase TatA/TatE family subunit [Balneolaceae bacterium]
MGSFGGLEWIVIGLAVLLLFGAKRIPELARGLGQGIKEFRKASDDIKREIEEGQQAPKTTAKSEPAEQEKRPEPENEKEKSENQQA